MYRCTSGAGNARLSEEPHDKIRAALTIRRSVYRAPRNGRKLSGLHNAVRRPGPQL